MSSEPRSAIPVNEVDVSLEGDGFMRSLLRELSGTLQDVVGLQEAHYEYFQFRDTPA